MAQLGIRVSDNEQTATIACVEASLSTAAKKIPKRAMTHFLSFGGRRERPHTTRAKTYSSQHTIRSYQRCVSELCRHYDCTPSRLSGEKIRGDFAAANSASSAAMRLSRCAN